MFKPFGPYGMQKTLRAPRLLERFFLMRSEVQSNPIDI